MLVNTVHGSLSGLEQSGLALFKGIRYARPPTGALRWRPPQPPQGWSGVRQATEFGPACPQPPSPPGSLYLDVPARMSEDCLFLNVWAPLEARRLPVMVWVHGGALRVGHTASGLYDGSALARHGVIVVTVGYRLGVLGYLAHPDLSAESDHGISGNYGLLDQIEALRWVRDNIAAFGGDPDNVTLFGESAGALSIIGLMMSPPAAGLFHKVILHSGYLMSCLELKRASLGQGAAEAIGEALAAKLGASDLADLRSMGALPLATRAIVAGYDPQLTIDGCLLPRQLVDALDRQEQARVPMIVGFNSGEVRSLRFFLPSLPAGAAEYEATVRRLYGDLADPYLQLYPSTSIEESALAAARDGFYGWSALRLARAQTLLGCSTYLYFFDHSYPAQLARGLAAFHGSELPYVFGCIGSDRLPRQWPAPPDQVRERMLAEGLMSYLTSFARSGTPVAPGQPTWEPYDAFLHIREGCSSQSKELLPGMLALHEEIIARRRAAGTQTWYVNVGLASPVVPPRM